MRLLDHSEQVSVHQPLARRNHEQFVKAVEGSLLHPLHELTSHLFAYTTQNKNVSTKSATCKLKKINK